MFPYYWILLIENIFINAETFLYNKCISISKKMFRGQWTKAVFLFSLRLHNLKRKNLL